MDRVGRVLGNLLAVVLMAFSLQAAAAEAQMGGRDFNHMVTGFPLTGGHAMTPCETCHLGGVFKGTPKTCDGCHALGKRIVATPKSTGHIVTDAPCETCHFNTSTFLGARFNHGTALQGQCLSCHNGRQSTARPANHTSIAQVANSCDQCHRTYAWVPASWNHVGVAPGTCASAGCHVQGSNQYFRGSSHPGVGIGYACDTCHNYTAWRPANFKHQGVTPGTCKSAGCHIQGSGSQYYAEMATSPVSHSYVDTSTKQCDVCHTSFASWTVTMHEPQTGTCSSCHNGSTAQGKSSGHVTTTDECNACHASTATWLGALGAKPANHIPYNAGVTCGNCHVGTAKVNRNTLHANSVATYTCATCHIKPNSYDMGQGMKSTHKGSSGNNCSNCHKRCSTYVDWSE